jgi:hypothetical protein
MANVLSNSGILNNQVIQAAHVSQSVNALTGIVSYDVSISGSLNVTGSTTLSGSSTTIRGGALSITSSNFNATLTQGTLDLGYSNNGGIIKAGIISASYYYVSQSLNYNILTASSILTTNLTASNIVTTNLTASNITASDIRVSNIITASTVIAGIISASNSLTASNLLVSESSNLLGTLYITGSPISLNADYDFIRFQRAITLAGTGPYNFSIIKITSSLDGITGNPDVTGSGIFIDPVILTLTNQNIWRSIQWNNNQGYGLYGSGSALNYLNGPLEINNNLLVTNANVTNALTASIVSASNWISASNIDASSIRSTNANVTNALTASIISASSWISASNIGASNISASTALTASLITTHTSPDINVTNALTSSIISASSWISASSIDVSSIKSTNITASAISASSTITTNVVTATTTNTNTLNTNALSLTGQLLMNGSPINAGFNFPLIVSGSGITIKNTSNSSDDTLIITGLSSQGGPSRTYGIPNVGDDSTFMINKTTRINLTPVTNINTITSPVSGDIAIASGASLFLYIYNGSNWLSASFS